MCLAAKALFADSRVLIAAHVVTFPARLFRLAWASLVGFLVGLFEPRAYETMASTRRWFWPSVVGIFVFDAYAAVFLWGLHPAVSGYYLLGVLIGALDFVTGDFEAAVSASVSDADDSEEDPEALPEFARLIPWRIL